ncbi:MAG TPA: GNAT family N-acetyltransferase [Acidimicrobiales bacterium]
MTDRPRTGGALATPHAAPHAEHEASAPAIVVGLADAADFDELGDIVVAAYASLDHPLDGGYARELRDVARRAVGAVVLAATEASTGRPVGCTTYVPGPESPWAERVADHEAGMRMLAVHPQWLRRGVGAALTSACVARARSEGRRALMLHSTPWMVAAHRLYARLGFVRAPDIDWHPVPDVPLLGYRLEL